MRAKWLKEENRLKEINRLKEYAPFKEMNFDLNTVWLYEPTIPLDSLTGAGPGDYTVNQDGSYTVSNTSVEPFPLIGVAYRIEYCKLVHPIGSTNIAMIPKLGDFLIGVDSETPVQLECNGFSIGNYNNQTETRVPLTTLASIKIIGVPKGGIKLRYSAYKDNDISLKPCTFIDSEGKTFLYKDGSFVPITMS